MTAVVPLDWRKLPLGDGRVLIEASAGTGKTWTIGAIFLRLLLERELPVEQILVVTFTDAAAQELRERLRARLADAERWLQAPVAPGKPDADPVARWLAKEFVDAKRAQAALRHIRIARMDFDRAPIATIHAFCQRIQNDFPLEAGANFAAAKRLDENALLRECLEDFWRQRYLAASAVDAEEADAVLDAGPADLLRDVRDLLNHDAKALPADGLEAILQSIRKLSSAESIAGLRNMASDKTLYAPKRTALSKRFAELADLLVAGEDVRDLLTSDKSKALNDTSIAEQLAAGIDLEKYPLVRTLQHLRELFKLRKTLVRGKVLADAYAYCRDQLPLRAAQRQGQTFSMLIEAVHARACDAEAHLTGRLHDAFPVALIDEFQDTDARQFAIFDRIYRAADGAPRGFLVLIGDPKQAIYGFRGGDIAAYLRAREGIAQRFDLTENFRSSEALIGACNALYGAMGDAFDDSAVRYVPVRPGGKADAKPFTHDSIAVDKPFVIHCFADAEQPRGNKDRLEQLALADCAARIVGVLNDATLRIGDERVLPGDIAVLLPKNAQVGALRDLLRARSVPCTGSGNDSVFEGETARELELILHAVLHPGDDRAARGALCTTILGGRLVDLRVWQDDAAAFERELDRFAHWHALLRSRGAMGVVAAILDERAADSLALPDGERIVADLRQLGELLAERERTESGVESVIAWLAAMRRDDKGVEVSGGYRLRSESDGSSVRLMTQHAAKGLEFPIVFLPLAWHIADRKGPRAPKVLRFHDADGKACVDLGSTQFERNRLAHFDEDLRERLRLLYVSVTRAKYAVHVYWIERNVAPDAPVWNTAAIDVLLHRAQEHLRLVSGEASLPALAEKLGGLEIVESCAAHEMKYLAPANDATRTLRAPLPELRPFLWSHSFSSITRQRVVNSLESAAADEAESLTPPEMQIAGAADEPEPAELLALDAWRGNVFGVVVHALLENGRAIQPSAQEIEKQMTTLGVHPQGGDQKSAFAALQAMLERVREADLGDGLRLSRLRNGDCVAEFGFQLPVAASLSTLRAVCAAHGAANVWPEHISLSALDGMLNGFADLIFTHGGRYHVLDYKTNRLGECLGDYREHAMQAAMDAHHYPLQALLYTVALHRYLQQRLPEYSPGRHLGDSWYLFLRGVGLAPGAGVWRRRWPTALIVALDEAFGGARIAA